MQHEGGGAKNKVNSKNILMGSVRRKRSEQAGSYLRAEKIQIRGKIRKKQTVRVRTGPEICV